MGNTNKHMKKSALSIILAIALIITIIPAKTVSAAPAVNSDYCIDTANQAIAVDRQILSSIYFGGVTYNVTRDDELAWEVFELINTERAKYGLPRFTMDRILMDTAMGRAAEITRKFDHKRPNGNSFSTAYPMATAANGYNGLFAAAENIAAGQLSAEEVISDWMQSPGHRNNILNANYVSIGIGCVKMNGQFYIYWVQSFGDRVLEPATRYSFVADGIDYSSVFDPEYYLSKYPDLKKAFGNNYNKAFQHFLKYGMREGRQAKSEFHVQSYRLHYRDLQRAYGYDWAKYYQHYILHGKKEGRTAYDFSDVFDVNYYYKKYADLRAAYGNNESKLYEHFLQHGMREGRQGSANFDVISYKNRYQDLRLAYGNDLTKYYYHYISYGKREGRNALNCPTVINPVTRLDGVDYGAVYDYYSYQARYADIKRVFGNDDIATLRHFINYGMKERRQAKDSFNVNKYIVSYNDLRKAFKYDYRAYYIHFIKNGLREGRKAAGQASAAEAKHAIDQTQ